MTTCTKPRRKYRFKSREDAEQAYSRESTQSVHYYRALRAMWLGEIRWLKDTSTNLGYRFGLFDEQSHSGPRLVITFQPTDDQFSLSVHDAYEWSSDTIGHYDRCPPSSTDREGQLMRELAYLVRREVNGGVA